MEIIIDHLPLELTSRATLANQLGAQNHQTRFDKEQCHDEQIRYIRTMEEEALAPPEVNQGGHDFRSRLARLMRLAGNEIARAHMKITTVALELIRVSWLCNM
jgi:hypothetical protein